MSWLPATMTNYLILGHPSVLHRESGCLRGLFGQERRGLGTAGTVLLAVGIVCHYLALMERSRLSHTVPYDDLYGSLSLFAWLLAATYLGLELFHRQRSVGAFILPVVLIVFLVSQAGHTVPRQRLPRAARCWRCTSR